MQTIADLFRCFTWHYVNSVYSVINFKLVSL